MEELSLGSLEQENEGLTAEELEKKKQHLLKQEKKCKAFHELINSPYWEDVKKVLKEDIYDNLFFSENSNFYHACWGIKMTIERIEARGNSYNDIVKDLMEDDK